MLGRETALAQRRLQNFQGLASNGGGAFGFAGAVLVVNCELLVGIESIDILSQKLLPERRCARIIALPLGKKREFSSSDAVDRLRETTTKRALVERTSRRTFAAPAKQPRKTIEIEGITIG